MLTAAPIEHDPEKWVPVFQRDHAQINRDRCAFSLRMDPHIARSAPSGCARGFGTMLDRRGGYAFEGLQDCGRGAVLDPRNAQVPLPPTLMYDHVSVISGTHCEST